jgi:bifunctional NMN adenylyltransferase/nudix hydrolase
MTTKTPSPAKRADHAIVIGRFQPLHKGHEHLIQKALEFADHVTVLIGSAGEARTPKNPWTYEERANMIYHTFVDVSAHIECAPLYDWKYADLAWTEQVQEHITRLQHNPNNPTHSKEVVLVGHDKDASTYYLKVFPQIKYLEAGFLDTFSSQCLDATTIRDLIFDNRVPYVAGVVSPQILKYINELMTFKKPEEFNAVKAWAKKIIEEKRKWANAPYGPPNFITIDNIVVQSGHVLLIQRGKQPGRGLWAMPGGFLEHNERIFDGALRELDEETKIKVQDRVLRRCFVGAQIFDSPERSLLGRIVTHVHLFKLDDAEALPRVQGSDDAMKAWWFPIAEIRNMRSQFYEDHFEILLTMLNKLYSIPLNPTKEEI